MNIDNVIQSKAHIWTLKSRSNPKTRQYWAGVSNGLVVFNPDWIVDQLEKARAKIQKAKSEGKNVLIISEKSVFKEELERLATQAGCHYLNYKVPGWVLTNFDTLLSRVKSMNDLRNYIESDDFQNITKKEKLMKLRQLKKVEMVYGWVKNLKEKPDLVIIIDGKYMSKFVDEIVKTRIDSIVLASSDFDRWWNEESLVITNVSFYESLKFALEYMLK